MKKILLNGFSSLGFAIPILYEIFVLIDSWIYALAAFAMQAFFAIIKTDEYIFRYRRRPDYEGLKSGKLCREVRSICRRKLP